MKVSNLRDIRRSWLLRGDVPAGNLESQLGLTVYRSWQRCLHSGLEAFQKQLPDNILSGSILQSRIDQRRDLIALAKPTMNYLHGLMSGSGGVIILSDHQGVIVHSVGDAQFVSKADRVLLKTGASWQEKHRGTNAIGTALVERTAVSINGPEHFLENNGFLSCTAAPIFAPDGSISGVLDISTDKNAYHPHTIGLVKATVHSLEKQLFCSIESQYTLVLKVHSSPEGLGSMGEGLMGLDENGTVLGVDRAALSLMEINVLDIGAVKIQQLLDISLDRILDYAKKDQSKIYELRTHFSKSLFFKFALNSSYARSHQTKNFDIAVDLSEEQANVSHIEEFESGALKQLSRIAIQKTLEKTNGNISLAAKLLSISRNTLYRYLKSEPKR
ncbi:GAF domain-containing protein [Polynucleobacter sp. MWH-Mekk-B1]|uniref:sigma-54-dependent Fis family transcriptional regulator n=1 Tax=Polynucleobacter finlandensis TaxID=1855894 RepID=UPI001C0DA250|nr:helix-turn-helix domain-containing protein [Polynucleobacter finlandensis]MBU3544169.1 GAF domain-containing protein [Polynucleobacter finlandensis]